MGCEWGEPCWGCAASLRELGFWILLLVCIETWLFDVHESVECLALALEGM